MNSYLVLFVLIGALALGVVAYVVWPLLRRPSPTARDERSAGDATAAVALAVLRERRRELETALAHLPADSPERHRAMDELTAQAADELAARADELAAPADGTPRDVAAPAHAAGDARGRPVAAAVLATLVVAPAVALYLAAGMPEAADPGRIAASADASVDALVGQLRAKLKAEPDRADGWHLLGRTELIRGRLPEAAEALERAATLAPRDAGIKVDLADVVAQLQGARLDGRPMDLVREALQLDPRHQKGLALAATWEMLQGNRERAVGLWRAVLEQMPAGSSQAREIESIIAQLRGESAAPGAAKSTAAAAVRGTVALAPALAGRVDASDALFVVARTLDEQGRPSGPPVAVLRARADALPIAFTLDDSMAMTPQARLSDAGRVVVTARVSRSGDATPKTGDLQGVSSPVAPGASGVAVTIDTVVP